MDFFVETPQSLIVATAVQKNGVGTSDSSSREEGCNNVAYPHADTWNIVEREGAAF